MIHGSPNSLDIIAKCEPALPVVHIVATNSFKRGPSVVIPASSIKHIFPAALSNNSITSSRVAIYANSPVTSNLFH